MPHEDGGGLQGGDRHLEVLVCADSEPLGRVQKLVIVDQVQGSASLGDDQPDKSWNCLLLRPRRAPSISFSFKGNSFALKSGE